MEDVDGVEIAGGMDLDVDTLAGLWKSLWQEVGREVSPELRARIASLAD